MDKAVSDYTHTHLTNGVRRFNLQRFCCIFLKMNILHLIILQEYIKTPTLSFLTLQILKVLLVSDDICVGKIHVDLWRLFVVKIKAEVCHFGTTNWIAILFV